MKNHFKNFISVCLVLALFTISAANLFAAGTGKGVLISTDSKTVHVIERLQLAQLGEPFDVLGVFVPDSKSGAIAFNAYMSQCNETKSAPLAPLVSTSNEPLAVPIGLDAYHIPGKSELLRSYFENKKAFGRFNDFPLLN